MEAEGGIHEIVLEIRRAAAAVAIRGVLPGADLPQDVQMEVTGEGDQLRVVLRFAGAYDAPVAELLRLVAESDADPVLALQQAQLELRVLSINGEGDHAHTDAAELDFGSAMAVSLPGSAIEAGPALGDTAMRVALGLLGAEVQLPSLIDPDRLAEGLLPLTMEGIQGVGEIRIGLGYDPDALELAGIEPIAEEVAVDLVRHDDGRATVTVQAAMGISAAGVVMLAALQLGKGRRGRRLGRIEILSLEADGVDLMPGAAQGGMPSLTGLNEQREALDVNGFSVPITPLH